MKFDIRMAVLSVFTIQDCFLKGIIKRPGHFSIGKAIGEWITYDSEGKLYKVTKNGWELKNNER